MRPQSLIYVTCAALLTKIVFRICLLCAKSNTHVSLVVQCKKGKYEYFQLECDIDFFRNNYDEGRYQISANHKNSPEMNELERELITVKILASNFEKPKS